MNWTLKIPMDPHDSPLTLLSTVQVAFPNVKELSLDEANVSYGKEGIHVNEFMQSTTNERIYAAGDVADTGYPFTLIADAEGRIVA